ncbi:MAG: hypothetical protein H0V29_08595 [Thermoleophilaceae bacterium]|nr:hypothetical protein [Thermoleophilaceae bacterium]
MTKNFGALAIAAALVLPAGAPAAAAPAATYPSIAAVKAAKKYAAERKGNVSFAVRGTDGRVRGLHTEQSFRSASLVKAMLLIADLNRKNRSGLSGADRGRLGPMIRRSSNRKASATFRLVGASGVQRVARLAGMTRFRITCCSWTSAKVTAADQARLFARIDCLAPERHREYAPGLLGGIVSGQRWGIRRAAVRRGWSVFFKSGWTRAVEHQAALLEKGGTRISVAVLTRGNPSASYGRRTQQGIARKLLQTPPP